MKCFFFFAFLYQKWDENENDASVLMVVVDGMNNTLNPLNIYTVYTGEE